jgi:hypothetical protein
VHAGTHVNKETELYEPRAFKLLANNMRVHFKQGEKGVPFDLGPALMYPLQVRGRVTDGQALGIGAYIPLESEIISTGEKTKGRLIVSLHTTRALQLDSDAAAATSNDLLVPVRVVLFGHKVEG